MELVRLRSLTDPSFTCAPIDIGTPAFQYQPCDGINDTSQPPSGSPHDAAATKASPSPLTPVLLSDPANFAALRCDWPHPAVTNLLLAQALPGVSLPGLGLPGLSPPLGSHPAGLWNRMLPALSTQQYPGQVVQLQSLSSLLQPKGSSGQHTIAENLPQPKVCVGFQEDWLEVSPAVLPLWPTAPFEPYAGPKPVQYLVLCPEELESKALLFVKDVGAMYELCNLGSSHPAAQVPWLYTFSTAHPPGSPSPHTHSQAQQAWDRLPQRERYLLGLRAAAERLQQALLTSPLQLHQEGPALELNPGASPVVFIVCPLGTEGLEGCLEDALLEAACCLAPCTPLGSSASHSSRQSDSSGSSRLWGLAVAAAAPLQPPGEPATPDPSFDRHAGMAARVGDGFQASATHMETDAAGEAAGAGGQEGARERYKGAAERLFQQEAGNCGQVEQQDFPRGDGLPLDLVLQVVGPHCYSDLSGQAATATAFEVYLKIWRRPPDPDAVLQHGSTEANGLAGTATPLVPFCSEPLFTLAPNRSLAPQQQHVSSPPLPPSPRPLLQPQPQQQQLQHGSPDMLDLLSSPYPSPPNFATTLAPSAQPPRTLHCCYALPDDLAACTVPRPRAHAAPVNGAADNSSCEASRKLRDLPQTEAAGSSSALLVPVAWTDSCGELLHCEVLQVNLQQGACAVRNGSRGGSVASTPGGSSRGQDWGDAAWGLVVGHVAQRCTELLGALCSASHPPNALQHMVFTRLGAMHSAEHAAWVQLLGGRAAGVVAGSSSQKMAVVTLQVETPRRLGTPSSLPGGWRVVSEQHGQQGTSATMLLLPGDDPAMLTLPGEHDTMRLLRLDLVASGCSSEHLGAQQALLERVQELQALALLNAAHYSLLYGSCTAPAGLRGGTGPPVAAHLPFHAALVGRLLSLLLLIGWRG